jgi:membrane protein DedA with SNARE-associated domain
VIIPVPSQIGYPVLGALVLGESAGIPLPGETALITAGALIADGHLSYPLVVLVATLAATTGDTIGYWVGRRKGRGWILRPGRFEAHRRDAVERADRFFDRFGIATVFFQRFIPGIRIVGALCAGAARMPWRNFALANASGAFTWAASVAGLSALVGSTAAFAGAAIGFVFGGITLAVVAVRQRRRLKQQA